MQDDRSSVVMTEKIVISQNEDPLNTINLESLSPGLRNLKKGGGIGFPKLKQDPQTKIVGKRVMQPTTKSFLKTAGSPMGTPTRGRVKIVDLNQREDELN